MGDQNHAPSQKKETIMLLNKCVLNHSECEKLESSKADSKNSENQQAIQQDFSNVCSEEFKHIQHVN